MINKLEYIQYNKNNNQFKAQSSRNILIVYFIGIFLLILSTTIVFNTFFTTEIKPDSYLYNIQFITYEICNVLQHK